ncbi:MAG: hypothetical protein JRS35_24570 [Deltaproteobacteria bacterium]|nr:hypothetical protein [Deltaproteobacteria bacterium]
MMGTRPRWLDLKMLYRRRPFVSVDLSRVLRGIALYVAAGTLLTAALPATARALIATCADGSVVFAKKWQDVHCSGAVEVAPEDVPQFGYVPRDRAAERRAFSRQHEAMRERDLEAQLAALPAVAAQARSTGPALPLVALSAAEYRDLARLVALSQERAAVAIERGAPPVEIRLAHSRAFEARLRADLAARGSSAPGPILLFSVEPTAGSLGAMPPSFAQRGVTFRPQPMDPSQLGWIAGADAAPARGAPRLGYVALPAGFDLARPLVVFWGDAVAAAWLRR